MANEELLRYYIDQVLEYNEDCPSISAQTHCINEKLVQGLKLIMTILCLKEIEFMSYLGGLLSMWIGFSFLGFYEVMEMPIQTNDCEYKERQHFWREQQ